MKKILFHTIIVFNRGTEEGGDYISMAKYIVFESSLLQLLSRCPVCLTTVVPKLEVSGSFVSSTTICKDGHLYIWESQPKLNKKKPVGNILIAAGIVFSGK